MSVGRNAKQAVVFLKAFYRDLQSLLVTCEQLLAEKGWKPPKSRQIAELSNALHKPHRWVLDSAFRSFTRSGPGGTGEAIVLLALLNMKHFEDAQVLAVRAFFPKPIKNEQLWNHWTNGTAIVDFLTTGAATMELPEDVFRNGALPDANRAYGFLVSVDELKDEAAARTLLLDPLLKLT